MTYRVITAFNPSNTANFRFDITLDGTAYTCVVNWNMFGERYYVNIYDASSNARLVTVPLIGSDISYILKFPASADVKPVSLTEGYTLQPLYYDAPTQAFYTDI